MPDEKIARICWNNNFWVSPSGFPGKSSNKTSYECNTGFGHEEWNFDTDKVVDGYVYGFLQQLNNKTDLHMGATYNTSFYSFEEINSNQKKKWWLGKINSVEVISGDDSERVYGIYKENGWLLEMETDLRKLSLDLKPFRETTKAAFFNIRFKISDMRLLDEPLEMHKNDPAIRSFHYKLLNKTQKPDLVEADFKNFIFKPGHNPGKNRTVVKSKAGKKNRSLFHNEIQSKIYELLVERYKEQNVGTENVLGYQTKVDIVVQDINDLVFYEIKTSQTAKAAIREAIGQILEYAFWPDSQLAKKLVIIAPLRPTSDAKTYVKRLRKDFGLPIYYQQYDVEKNILMSEV